MTIDLEPNLNNILVHFYKKLEKCLKETKNKLDGNSVLLTLVKLTKNKVSEILTQSAIEGSLFEKFEITELTNKNYLRVGDRFDKSAKYILTTHGIWQVESSIKGLNITNILDYYQEDKFSSRLSGSPLSDKDKIILLSMISMRNFSISNAMDLNEDNKCNTWIEVFDDCAEFSKSKKIIKIKNWKPKRLGNEHPVNYVMRRANNLPQKTRHIYQTGRNYQYYLNIPTDFNEAEEKLEILFRLIFDEIKSLIEIEEIHKFLCNSAFEKSVKLISDFDYISPEWDRIMQSALERMYYGI